MAYLLIPLDRRERGDSFYCGSVRNGGLWWPVWASKIGWLTLLSWVVALLPQRRPWLGYWHGGVASGGNEGEARWHADKSLRRERCRSIGFKEGEKELLVLKRERDVVGAGGKEKERERDRGERR